MPLGTDLYHFQTLTEAVNQIIPPSTLVLDLLFQDAPPSIGRYINVDQIVGNKKLAPFSLSTVQATPMSKLNRYIDSYEFPRIRLSLNYTAEQLLEARAPGEDTYLVRSSASDSEKEGAVRKSEDYLVALAQQTMKDAVTRRKEWMACKALQAGGFTYSDGGVTIAVDFSIPAGNKKALTGADCWTDATADIIANIREGKRGVRANTGKPGNIAIAGYEAVENMLSNTEVKELLDNRRVALGQLTIDNADYVGRLVGVDIYEYTETYESGGSTYDFITPDQFIITSTQIQNLVEYGAIYDLDAPRIIGQYFSKAKKKFDPSNLQIIVESRPFPILREPNGIWIIDTDDS